MENKKQEKLIQITKDEYNYYCTVKLPNDQLIKFHERSWQTCLNKLGHLLIALTSDIERTQFRVAI